MAIFEKRRMVGDLAFQTNCPLINSYELNQHRTTLSNPSFSTKSTLSGYFRPVITTFAVENLDPYQSTFKMMCYGRLVYMLVFFSVRRLASQWCGHFGGKIETW